MKIRGTYIAVFVACFAACFFLGLWGNQPVIAQDPPASVCRLVLPDNIPDDVESIFQTGRDYLAAGQFERAIDSYGVVLARLEHYEQHTLFKSQVVLALAYALYAVGRADEAVPRLQHTIETLRAPGDVSLE